MVTLMVASTGGHLHQLWRLSRRFDLEGPQVWVTFESAQSTSLLAEADVRFVPYVAPRDYRAVAACVPHARRILREHDVSAVVSTGSGIALAFLPLAVAKGIPAHYIESATRFDGPSLTGRVLRRTPGVQLYTQWESWADRRWRFAGSVFDGFEVQRGKAPSRLRRVVVSLGTIRPFGFRRLLERLLEIVPDDCEVIWQTGCTDVRWLPIEAEPELPEAKLRRAIRQADVLIAHAGTGIALTALEEGRCPLLVPREHRYGEHVDDHQTQTAEVLSAAGLALARRVDELALGDLLEAAGDRVTTAGHVPPFRLTDRPRSDRR